MHRIDTPTAQKDKFGQGKNGFTNGDPTTGTPSTKLNGDIYDALQEEVCTVVERSGIRLNKSQHDQLYQAIKKLSETEANNAKTALIDGSTVDLNTLNKLAKALGNDPKFSETVTNLLNQKLAKNQNGADIPDKNLFLKNLGLLEMVVPVGVPLPWPAKNAPVGWLKCNGDAFDKIACPQLATVYPSGRTPDLRGEFIRGWDNGREVDASRVLLSSQLDDFKAHRHESYFYAGISRHEVPLISLPSSDEMLTLSSTLNSLSPVSIDANGSIIGHDDYNCLEEGNKNNKRTATSLSTNIIGGNETRPRNIAFNYIVRAA